MLMLFRESRAVPSAGDKNGCVASWQSSGTAHNLHTVQLRVNMELQ